MAQFEAGFKVTSDPSAFERGMARATAAGNSFKKSLASIGVEAKGLGLGLALGIGLAALRRAVDDAREVAAEAKKLGKDIDGGTMALIRFGDTMSGLRGVGTTIFGGIVQVMEQIGVRAGALVYGWEAAADAAGNMKKEAEAAVKALTDEKLTAALNDLAKFRQETGYKRASDEDKINILLTKQVELIQQQTKAGKESVEGVKLQLEIDKNRVELAEVNARIEKERAKGIEEIGKELSAGVEQSEKERVAREGVLQAEKDQIDLGYEREAQLKAQNAELEAQERRLSKMLALSSMLNAAGGEAFNDASDEALGERLRRSRQRLVDQRNNPIEKDGSVGAMIVGADIGRLQVEIQNIKAEMAFREKLRRDFSIGGESMARRNFKGDPLEFDRVFQQLVQDNRDTKVIQSETLTQLREINQRQKSGIAVVNLNKK